MAWQVLVASAATIHGPMLIPDGFLADHPEPTAAQVLAEFARRLVEDVDQIGMPGLGFNPPLTITIEKAT